MTQTPGLISRRDFLGLSGGVLLASACNTPTAPFEGNPRLDARPGIPTVPALPGLQPLGLGGDRDGFIYVPAGYAESTPAPLLLLLHGATGSAGVWSASTELLAQADNLGVVLLGVDSREVTWDLVLRRRFDADLTFINRALTRTFSRCRIDPTRVAVGGFSDGATYALSLGLPNGDLFTHVVGWSAGYLVESQRRGTPGVWMSHGTLDTILPIDQCSRVIVPRLRTLGYTVDYREFGDGHVLRIEDVTAAMEWMAG